jgi:hypothetical protein
MGPKGPRTLFGSRHPCCLLNLRQLTSPQALLQFFSPSSHYSRSLIEVDINWGWNQSTFFGGTVAHSFFSPTLFFDSNSLPSFNNQTFQDYANSTLRHIISYTHLTFPYISNDRSHVSTGLRARRSRLATRRCQCIIERLWKFFRRRGCVAFCIFSRASRQRASPTPTAIRQYEE